MSAISCGLSPMRDAKLAGMTLGGPAVSGTFKWGFPIGPWVTWHRPTALASARQVLGLKPTRLAVGHGPVLEQPDSAIAQAIAEAEAALAGGRHA